MTDTFYIKSRHLLGDKRHTRNILEKNVSHRCHFFCHTGFSLFKKGTGSKSKLFLVITIVVIFVILL